MRIPPIVTVSLALFAFTSPTRADHPVEITILVESFDGCGCLGEFADPISCPPCPTGVLQNHPDCDFFGPNSLDHQWQNAGWPVDMFGDPNVVNQGFASQGFTVASGSIFNETAAFIIQYDNLPDATCPSPNPAVAFDMEAARMAQGLPDPVPDGTSYFLVEWRRHDDAPQTKVTTGGVNAFSRVPHPEATNNGFVATPFEIPNDDQWYEVTVLEFDHYVVSIGGLSVFVDLDPPGLFDATTADITINIDNIRYVYTAMVPDTETVCDNEVDDDFDGLTDCEDEDCQIPGVCPGCFHDPVFDVDDDGDVDGRDFAVFQTCITGTGDPGGQFSSLSEDCRCMDVSGTGDVPDETIDQQDYAVFEACASGPGIPTDPDCDGAG